MSEPCGVLADHAPHWWQLMRDGGVNIPFEEQERYCDGTATPRRSATIISTPEEAEALPVGAVLTAGDLLAVKRADEYPKGRPGWRVRGFASPLQSSNGYPVVDRTLFRYASAWICRPSSEES